MKLNLEYNHNENEIETLEEYEEVLKRVEDAKNEDFSKTLDSHAKIKNILALSEIRENLLNWYPFKENATILEVKANYGELTELLCQKAQKVISIEASKKKADIIEKRHHKKENLELIVGNFMQIELQEKFDYIVIVDIVENLKQVLEQAKKYLKEDGIIILAVNNQFGVKAWITAKEEAKVVNNSKTAISKKQLEALLEGMKYEFYYPLPDYKLPNIIYTKNSKPTIYDIYRDITYKDENVNFKEVDAYREIIKNNPEDFAYFANSFLVFASKQELKQENIRFITFSNMRKDEYRIKTIVKEKEVIKTNVNEKSKKHIEKIKENIEILNQLEIKLLDTFQDGKVISEYTEKETLEDRLIAIYQEQGKEAFINTIKKYEEFLKEKLQITDSIENNVFTKYKVECEKEKLDQLTFIQYGFWDLIFQNCFILDNDYYFYDQEWLEENMPVEYIIYRAILYFHESKQYISDEQIFEELHITEFVPMFQELDNKIQEKIRKPLMWNIHTKEELERNKYKKVKQELQEKQNEITNLKNELESLKGENTQKKNQLVSMQNSFSWRITKPLRKIRGMVNKK